MAQSKLPEDLEQRLLALAPADRLALATRLLASVEGPDPDRDDAWSAELDRRDVCARRLVDVVQRRVLDGLRAGVHEARQAMPIASRAAAAPA